MDLQTAFVIHFGFLTNFFEGGEVGGKVQTRREYCVSTVVVGRLKGYIQTFGGSGK